MSYGPNMSYCKFENTLAAMRQCFESLADGDGIGSTSEKRAFKKMVEEMRDFLFDFDLMDEDYEEVIEEMCNNDDDEEEDD